MQYRSALRFDALAWAYDPIAMRIVRARRWRPAMVAAAAPAPGRRILDLGCGTGTLCLLLKTRCPEARVIGIDPDPTMLARARRKATAAGFDLPFLQASATALPVAPLLDRPVDVCLASLMFHHLDRAQKQAALAEAVRMLAPGGHLLIADWGPPHTPAGRLAFGITQVFDGFATTGDHAGDAFVRLIAAAGVTAVDEIGRWPTSVGILYLYSARKPGDARNAPIAAAV